MSKKDFSSKQEKMIADFLGWKVVSGSGAKACHPGDIIGEDWLGECKTHTTPHHPIFFSSDVWSKIIDEAAFQHRTPVLFTDDGSQKIDKTWCIINHFSVDDSWIIKSLGNKPRVNLTMNHADLLKLYPVDSILSNSILPICYLAALSRYKVAILPLRLFKFMFE